jgi:hypothetical protein
MTMIYCYADVSKVAQDLNNQVTQLKAAGSAIIFREKVSSATAKRPELKKLTAKLAKRCAPAVSQGASAETGQGSFGGKSSTVPMHEDLVHEYCWQKTSGVAK